MSAETIVSIIAMVLVSILGLMVNGYRAKIAALEADLKAVNNELKDIREKYARRDDLNGHLAGIVSSIVEVKDQIKELTKLVLASIVTQEKRQ